MTLVQNQLYLPIKDVEYQIIPKVALLVTNIWEAQLYAQENDLTVLSSPDINRVASAVREEKPSKQFIRYARERAELNDNDVANAYRQLHEQIWRDYFWIRAREVLVWMGSDYFHPRVISDKILSKGESYLIKDYRVVDRGKNDYVLDTTGIPNPVIPVNWLRREGRITPEMAQLLGAPENTSVSTNPDTEFYEGLRTLVWVFSFRVRPDLLSDWEPWDRLSGRGSLVGRKL